MPLSVHVNFYFSRPKSHYRWNSKHRRLELAPDAPVFVLRNPDLDNLLKLVLDAVQGVFCQNDNMVAEVEAKKMWIHNTAGTPFPSGDPKHLDCMILKITQLKTHHVAP